MGFVGRGIRCQRQERLLHLVAFPCGLLLAGAFVGAMRRLPELWGSVAGLLVMSLVALVVGPKDG